MQASTHYLALLASHAKDHARHATIDWRAKKRQAVRTP